MVVEISKKYYSHTLRLYFQWNPILWNILEIRAHEFVVSQTNYLTRILWQFYSHILAFETSKQLRFIVDNQSGSIIDSFITSLKDSQLW